MNAEPLPEGPFHTVIADPPWQYNDKLGTSTAKTTGMYAGVRGSAYHYNLMTLAEIKALPVGEVAAWRSHLYLWTTNAFMVEAHEVARAWGFEPKTILTWVKVKRDAQIVGDIKIGMGFYYRNVTEHVLFCTRGKPVPPVRVHNLPGVFFAERDRHSAKPAILHELAEAASEPRYLELFARSARPLWTPWGYEAPVIDD